MANNSNNVHYIRGKAHWAKVIGTPRKNNFDDYREWTIDVSPDADGVKLLKQLGISDRLRSPKEDEDRSKFITFKQRELKADGTTNQPIKIVDANQDPWGDKLLGNGTVVNVKFAVKDYGPGKKKGVYIRAIQVLDLVSYEAKEFPPLDEDDEFFSSPVAGDAVAPENSSFEEDMELEDDIPE